MQCMGTPRVKLSAVATMLLYVNYLYLLSIGLKSKAFGVSVALYTRVPWEYSYSRPTTAEGLTHKDAESGRRKETDGGEKSAIEK